MEHKREFHQLIYLPDNSNPYKIILRSEDQVYFEADAEIYFVVSMAGANQIEI